MIKSQYVVAVHDTRSDGVWVLTPHDAKGPEVLRSLADCFDGDRIDIADRLRDQAADWDKTL